MTQLDVPTVSFAHYLDLFKRRTWHVVIVGGLGLLIGGLVAMMIPRYYVASTTVSFNRPVLDSKLGTPDDPMVRVVMEARHTVSRVVPEAVVALKWPEALSGNEEQQRNYIAGVRKRVFVVDVGTKNRNRQIAELEIRYYDVNGDRSANLANMLRDLWLDKYVVGLKRVAEKELQAVMADKRKVLIDRAAAARLVANFEREHEMDPQNDLGTRDARRSESRLSKDIAQLKLLVDADDDSILDAESRRVANQTLLEGTDRTLEVQGIDRFGDPVMMVQWMRIRQTIQRLTAIIRNVTEIHMSFKPAQAALIKAEADLREFEEGAGGAASSSKRNPEYDRIERELRELKRSLALRKQQRTSRQTRLGRYATRLSKLPGIHLDYNTLRRKLEQLDDKDRMLGVEHNEKSRAMRLIRTIKPFDILQEAIVPTRPTEPNPYLQALIGCLVGLAAAVGLVILIDFLQMTFKSIGDVESGLGLPVLGSLSYLETEAEIFETRDRRAKMAIFTVVVLVLSLTVVTIYYITPTQLPQFVVNILDALLGDSK